MNSKKITVKDIVENFFHGDFFVRNLSFAAKNLSFTATLFT